MSTNADAAFPSNGHRLDLSDQEKQQIKALIDRGEPLPSKYRLRLFTPAPEMELLWQGKNSEVTNVVLPFQSIEQVDEPRVHLNGQKLFAADAITRRQSHGWTNKLIWGDNKLVLSSLKNGPLRREIEAAGGLKLIYIDPPFDVGADFSVNIEIGEETLTKEPSIIEEIAYRDTWGRGTDSYLSMIFDRLRSMRDLLADDGSIFMHMGANISHIVRCAMEDVFGNMNFRNEIILPGRAVKNLQQQFSSIGRLQVRHDALLWFSKKPETRFAPHWVEKHDVGNLEGHWHHFWSNADRPTMRYELFGVTPKSGQWVWKEERALKAVKNYQRFLKEAGGRSLAQYWRDTGSTLEFIRPDPEDGKPLSWRAPAELRISDSVWSGLPIYSAANNYPTEKNERFLEEVLTLSTKSGDLVADFFCGSGTTLAVAEKLGRKWIGCDLGRFAIHTTRKRLIGVQRQLKSEDKPYRSFEILNLGKYERQYFVGIDPTLPEAQRRIVTIQKEEHYLSLILSAYKAERLIQMPPFHGRKGSTLVLVGPIDAPVTLDEVYKMVDECRRKKLSKVDVLGFEFEMGVIPFVRDEAKHKGISLSLKYIPKDVFDKRAVERGQVQFYDVAYVEVLPMVEKLSVTVNLKDFGVFYRQENLETIGESLKPGRGKVTVQNGQVIKVLKDKQGRITREVLTKKWTDWIDYWAVDFHFESKREILRVIENGQEQEVWTGNYVFENEWQSFRTRKDRTLELASGRHDYPARGKYKVAVKVIDIFGNDTTKVVEIKV